MNNIWHAQNASLLDKGATNGFQLEHLLCTLCGSLRDLAANYVGLKFYHGLTQPILIGGSTHPAVLLLKDGLWTFNDRVNLREELLKPFISNHLNEALNPSVFTKNFGLRWYIRRTVRKRSCAQWFARCPNLSQSELEEQSRALTIWQGEDYGFTDSEHFITIANTCFEKTVRE